MNSFHGSDAGSFLIFLFSLHKVGLSNEILLRQCLAAFAMR